MTSTNERFRAPSRDIASGLALASGALLSVLLMAHHPTPRAHGSEGVLQEIVEIGGMARLVHGGMIAVLALQAFGFAGLALDLGIERAPVRLGLVAYVLGALALVGAGLLNGFVAPAVAEHYAGAGEADAHAARAMLAFAWAANQTLAGCGVLALSAATLAWSATLVRLPGAWRWIGALGLAVGAVGALAYLTGRLELDVQGFGRFVLGQGAWAVAAGAALARAARR